MALSHRYRNIVVPITLHETLKKLAKKEGRLIQALVEQLLLDALKNRKAA